MKKNLAYGLFVIALIILGCDNNSTKTAAKSPSSQPDTSKQQEEVIDASYDPTKGEGKFMTVKVTPALNKKMAENGENLFKRQCESCHNLTDQKAVGPGMKDVTRRHSAEWIMNFITNTDEMHKKDPYVKMLLKTYKMPMPVQYLSDEQVREVYEFMRKNDGMK